MVFLVESDQYGEATPVEEQRNIQDLSETAEMYNIPGFAVNGMDIAVVCEAVREARRRAANDEGPTLIKTETYRYHGYLEGDQ